jgi:nitrate reductase cytochrome c-type subunit
MQGRKMSFLEKFVTALLLLFIPIILDAYLHEYSKIYQERGLATGQPGINRFSENPPGETTVLDRLYDGAPPMIPHDINGLAINGSENECLDCHMEGLELDEGHTATKIPASHYINEYTKEQKKDQVLGIRYNCLQCHVPQSEEEPPYFRVNH